MARAKVYTVRCVEPGCRETAIYEYERVSEKRVTDWRCWRHRRPEEVIGATRPLTRQVLTVVAEPYGKFWHDGTNNTSGYVFGPGFKAQASDFPVGTTLTITAELCPAADGVGS